jgi:hypothetical protein
VSVNIKITKIEAAAIVIAAAFVWGPLLMGVSASAVTPTINKIPSNRVYQEIWQGVFVIPGAGWNLLLVLVGFGQLLMYGKQAGIMDHQRKLMEGQLKATQATADAAIAAIDRPFIFIESASTLEDRRNAEIELFIARFRLANYGNAPASLVSIRGQVFVALEPDWAPRVPANLAFPQTALIFPNERQIRNFVGMGSRPLIAEGEISLSGDRDGTKTLTSWRHLAPSGVVAPGQKSQELAFAAHIPIGLSPAKHLFKPYVMGCLTYKGLTDETETVWFCYEGISNGLLIEKYGAPYNCRVKGRAPSPPPWTELPDTLPKPNSYL